MLTPVLLLAAAFAQSLATQSPTPPTAPATSATDTSASAASAPVTLGTKTKNVFLVMADGLRWQEVFTGADTRLIHKDFGVSAEKPVRDRYWRQDPADRRAALMPFVWSTVAAKGQIYGNLHKGSSVKITNPHKVSYPGYSEIFCGFTHDAIKDNRRIPNPSVTVFEWLHNQPGFKGKVAAFGSWDLFPSIFNTQRCGFPVDDGLAPITFGTSGPIIAHTNTLRAQIPRRWSTASFDALVVHPALEWIQLNKPRIVFLGTGETDEWAHENKYEHYLDAAHRVDAWLAQLWAYIQSDPFYKDSTTIIFTPDHGRGGDDAPGYTGGQLKQWADHNPKVIGAEQTWLMIWGPDTPPLGEAVNTPPITQSQIASTMAALLGHDYPAAQPKAGSPIPGAIVPAPKLTP